METLAKLQSIETDHVLGSNHALNLTINEYGAKVVTYDDQVFTHRSASKLVKQLTGLTIPVDHLPQWLLGNPDMKQTPTY